MINDFKQWFYKRNPDYSDINESSWFKDIIAEACKKSERSGNRIFVYFPDQASYDRAVAKCERRNICCIGPMSYVDDPVLRLDIMMNWRDRVPLKFRKKEKQNLD